MCRVLRPLLSPLLCCRAWVCVRTRLPVPVRTRTCADAPVCLRVSAPAYAYACWCLRVPVCASACVWVCACACIRACLRVSSVRLHFAHSAALSCLRLGYPFTRRVCAFLCPCLVPLWGSCCVTLLCWLAPGCKGGGIEKRAPRGLECEGPFTLHRGFLVQVCLLAGGLHGCSFVLGWAVVCAWVGGIYEYGPESESRICDLRRGRGIFPQGQYVSLPRAYSARCGACFEPRSFT